MADGAIRIPSAECEQRSRGDNRVNEPRSISLFLLFAQSHSCPVRPTVRPGCLYEQSATRRVLAQAETDRNPTKRDLVFRLRWGRPLPVILVSSATLLAVLQDDIRCSFLSFQAARRLSMLALTAVRWPRSLNPLSDNAV
jgi:hypothetical protein